MDGGLVVEAKGAGAHAIAFSDLDRTLIYSEEGLELTTRDHDVPQLLCVEVFEGRSVSFVTRKAAQALRELNLGSLLVPTTTRTIEQYRRIALPGPRPHLALCANGGRLLRDGVEDLDFTRDVAALLAGATAPLSEVSDHLRRSWRKPSGSSFVRKLRSADDLFCYAIVDWDRVPSGWFAEVSGFGAEVGWSVSVQGRKIYFVPDGLSKGRAARVVAQYVGASSWVAAGDSLLDVDLLEGADAAIRPMHGELMEHPWKSGRVEVTSLPGVLAGEEIVGWLLAQTQGCSLG